jgi:probable rRNA maturation factor
MKRPLRPALKVDVRVESKRWNKVRSAKSVVRQAVTEAAAALSTTGAELAIILADDSTIRLLNRNWRGVDAATNVLSFPTAAAGGEPPLIGDIVLGYETVAREARAEGKPFAHHVAHLAVHGFLHLVGYDHARDKDAEAMERVERRILRRLAIPDPYRRRLKSANKPSNASRKIRLGLRPDSKP